MFASVYAENVKVRVSLCGERQTYRQFMRRTSKFVPVYAEKVKRSRQFMRRNIKARVSLCGERKSLRQFIRRP